MPKGKRGDWNSPFAVLKSPAALHCLFSKACCSCTVQNCGEVGPSKREFFFSTIGTHLHVYQVITVCWNLKARSADPWAHINMVQEDLSVNQIFISTVALPPPPSAVFLREPHWAARTAWCPDKLVHSCNTTVQRSNGYIHQGVCQSLTQRASERTLHTVESMHLKIAQSRNVAQQVRHVCENTILAVAGDSQ